MLTARTLSPVFIILLALMLVLSGCSAQQEGGAGEAAPQERGGEDTSTGEGEEAGEKEGELSSPQNGRVAPDFTLPDLEGETYSLEDFRGQVVVLNFWNSGCRYCLGELPLLDTLQKEGEGEVVVLAVNIGDSAATVADLWEQEGYGMLALLDDGTVASQYLVRPIPDTLIIDAQGDITARFLGAQPLEELQRAVAAAKEM